MDAQRFVLRHVEAEKAKLARELELAHKVIGLQKKASAMLDLLPVAGKS